jgi:hypothetical protein
MNKNGENPAQSVFSAGERYCGVLRRTEEITDELLAAIDSWSVDEIPRLIDERFGLCEAATEAFGTLDALAQDALHRRGGHEPVAQEVESYLESVRTRQQSLAAKQSESERLLSAGLRNRRRELLSVRRRRDKRNIYPESDSQHGARFLDTAS